MARPLRYLPSKCLVEITGRAVQGRLLLRPSPRFNEVFIGVLGRAQRRFDMVICGVVCLSSHYHLIAAPESPAQLAGFMAYFAGNLAREVGRLHDWKEKVWGRRYRAIPISDEPAAQIGRLRYLLENGIKEGLVEHPRDWPGVHSIDALTQGVPLEGIWVNRTAEYTARRRRRPIEPAGAVEHEAVSFASLPCWAHLEVREQRRQVADLVDEVVTASQQDRAARNVLGSEAILRQAPHERPAHTERSPAPAVHAASRSIRIAMKLAYRDFLAAFRLAAGRLKAGLWPVVFPPGAFPPRLPSVAWAPS